MASFANSRTGLPLGSGEDGQHSTLSDARDESATTSLRATGGDYGRVPGSVTIRYVGVVSGERSSSLGTSRCFASTGSRDRGTAGPRQRSGGGLIAIADRSAPRSGPGPHCLVDGLSDPAAPL